MRHYPRRSSTVTLTLLSGIASAVLAACRGGDGQRHCVDQQDRVVPDSLCRNVEGSAERQRGGGIGGAALWFPYRYYYGGSGYAGIGSRMRGGSYAPAPGRVRSSPARSGTARGGFGGIGSGRGIGG